MIHIGVYASAELIGSLNRDPAPSKSQEKVTPLSQAQRSLQTKKYIGIALTVVGIVGAVLGLVASILAGPAGFFVLVGGIGLAALAKTKIVDKAEDKIAWIAYETGVTPRE